MATLSTSLILTGAAVVVAVSCMIFVRRKIIQANLKLQHDVADPLMSVVGTLFAVLLGFMIANAMTRFEEIRDTTQHEASTVTNIYRAALGLPSPDRENLKKGCEEYVDAVIDDEWALLKSTKTSQPAWKSYGEIWTTIVNIDPQNNRVNNLQSALVGFAGELGDCRRVRVGAEHNGLPMVLWIVLVVGGLATIIFTYFFIVENLTLQILMTSLVTIAICLNMFLLASYDDPFSGDVMVKPTPFEYARKSFQMMSRPGSGFQD